MSVPSLAATAGQPETPPMSSPTMCTRGESRSHDTKFFREITKAYKSAFEKAAKRVKNSEGKSGRIKFKAETDYYPFRMKESLPVVKRAVAAVSAIGGTPAIRAAKWRARRELDGPPRCSDRDLRRRTERAAHDRRMDQSRRVRPDVCAGSTACDDAVASRGSLRIATQDTSGHLCTFTGNDLYFCQVIDRRRPRKQ